MSPVWSTSSARCRAPRRGGGAAAHRHIDEIGAGFLFPALDRDLHGDSERAIAQRARLGVRQIGKLIKRINIQLGTDDHHLRVDEGVGNRCKILLRIVRDGFIGELVERQGLVRQETDCITVICGFRTSAPGDHHGAAGPIIDDDELSKALLQHLGKSANKDVARTADAIGCENANRPCRIVLSTGYLNVVAETDSPRLMLEMMKAGLGYTIAPYLTFFDQLRRRELAGYPIGNLAVQRFIITRKDRSANKAIHLFKSLLRPEVEKAYEEIAKARGRDRRKMS
jgi:DNA-binding transcriptional LysR family regulator